MRPHLTHVAATVCVATALTLVAAQPPAPEQKPEPPQPPAPQLPPRNLAPPFFNPGEPAVVSRTRVIKAVFRGQRIEISDRGNKEIRMKVTRTVDGQPVPEEFQAADPETLRRERPELGALYDRLAGPR
uniref:SLA1 homology domain-containing protein n=1 Tax=Schlesneria paludicola TaxID=360056 RepID=A0A7C2P6P4_9PLAN